MNHDETYSLNEQSRITEECQCESCGKYITGPEALDPCIIEHQIFCDKCASDLTMLRLEGYLKPVSDRTAPLVNKANYDLSHEMGMKLVPFGKVRHI